jgi:hypothetical protein
VDEKPAYAATLADAPGDEQTALRRGDSCRHPFADSALATQLGWGTARHAQCAADEATAAGVKWRRYESSRQQAEAPALIRRRLALCERKFWREDFFRLLLRMPTPGNLLDGPAGTAASQARRIRLTQPELARTQDPQCERSVWAVSGRPV